MSLPIINFKFTNTDTNIDQQDLITNKFQTLERFIGNETDVKIDVEFEKVTNHQSGKIQRVEANVWVAGKLFRAEATEDSFEIAVDEVRDELDKEMRRDNDKHVSLIRRGGRKIKEMLRFGS